MTPETTLTLSLVAGAVLGAFARLWLSPSFETWSKQLIVEVLTNGIAALLIPYLGVVIPALDVTKLPPLAAGGVMFFIASGSGDFVGNIRRKITGEAPPSPVA